MHGKNLWAAIAQVADKDKELAVKLADEYEGVLTALVGILDDMSKRLEH